MAERSNLDDPLNLMRVMPSKGARVRCRTGDFQPCDFSAHGFLFCETYESGKQERRKTFLCFFKIPFSSLW
jgi:hypothetical protein